MDTKTINELYAMCESATQKLDTEYYTRYWCRFNNENHDIYINRMNNDKFQTNIEKFYYFNKDIAETWSLKLFRNELLGTIMKSKSENRACNNNDISKLYAKLLSIENNEFTMFYGLHGVRMSQPTIDFEDFTIHRFDSSSNELLIRFRDSISDSELYISEKISDYLLEIKVKARDEAKAFDNADKLCETFENIFSYMNQNMDHMQVVQVFNIRRNHYQNILYASNGRIGNYKRDFLTFSVNIEDSFYKDNSSGNDKIWELIAKKDKTEIETRILNSVQWIGKANRDLDSSKALVQFVFAIEGMLQYDSGAFINPSIVHQIGESLAFVIHDNPEHRNGIYKEFAQIYKKRSAISHGASQVINNKDLHKALAISKLLITAFLTKEPFCRMKTMKEVSEYLTQLKFK